eukprot:983510_1
MASLDDTETEKTSIKSMSTTNTNKSPISQSNAKLNTESEEEFFPLAFFKNHKFEAASKRISTHSHIGKFLTSPTYTKLIKFLHDLSSSVQGQKISDFDASSTSSTTIKFIAMLKSIEQWVDEIEPLQIQSRYGNKAFRIWQNKLKHESKAIITQLLPDSWTKNTSQTESKENDHTPGLTGIVNELSGYLLGSFGDITRIDYGTGHELTFICFLLILKELRVFRHTDYSAIVLLIFEQYINLMRKIQTKYGLEPAGTKGVWGLDDYQFLPFYFGAAQLMDHKHIKPKDILNKEILTKHSSEYLYLSSIQFILQMKTGPFGEHSPLLFDISAVPYWHKVKSGLLKMYQEDVLKKLPVIQHFLFGSVLSIDLPPIDKDAQADEKAEILKRKQALIAKLNAKNPNFQNANTANTNTNTSPIVGTAAPWAQQHNTDNNEQVVTKAPWAK